MSKVDNEAEIILQKLPWLKDQEHLSKFHRNVVEILRLYGFNEREVLQIVDHRWFLLIEGYLGLENDLKDALDKLNKEK